VAYFPIFGNLATAVWHYFQVSETLSQQRGILSKFRKPHHGSVAFFPSFGNLATAAWHIFQVLETSPRQCGIFPNSYEPLRQIPDSGLQQFLARFEE